MKFQLPSQVNVLSTTIPWDVLSADLCINWYTHMLQEGKLLYFLPYFPDKMKNENGK